MAFQNPFQFNLVDDLKIHLFKIHFLSVCCVAGTKLDIRNRVVSKPGIILAQMELTFK